MGKGRRLAVLCAAVWLWGAAAPAALAAESRFAQPEFDVPCKAAVLMEQGSGTVLYAKNPDIQLPEASITKVMTLLLTMEALDSGRVSLQDIVPVSEHASSMGGSQIWLEPGEQMTLEEMLRAICVSSANDAAVAVAEWIGGSEAVFVERMNQRAAELGMANTHYCNACGLDAPGHVSSARDVALLSREILTNHPSVTEFTRIWMDSLRGGATQLVNTNKLLKKYSGITGLKTGTTGGAGVCITASASREGLDLIAVVLGAASSEERFAAATALLDYGFGNFHSAALSLPEQAPGELPVSGGRAETVALRYDVPSSILLENGEEGKLELRLELPEKLEAPLEAGQQVGAVTVWAGQELMRCPVRAEAPVPVMDLKGALESLLRGLLAG